MSASASKKKRKDLEAQGLSPKTVAAQKEKEQKSKSLRNGLMVALVAIAVVAIVLLVVKLVNNKLNEPSYDTSLSAVTVGDEKVTVPVYNYFYNLTASNMYSNYSFLFKAGVPFSQQNGLDGKGTLEDYMKDIASKNIEDKMNLYIEAKKNNYSLTDEQKQSMDASIEAIEKEASSYGYANVDKYLRARFGEGCTEDNYKDYLNIYLTATGYASKLSEEFKPTADELNATYTKDPSAFDLVRFTYMSSAAESTPVESDEEAPTEGTEPEGTEPEGTEPAESTEPKPTETTYTAEAKAAAREKAETYAAEMPEDASSVTYNKDTVTSYLTEEIAAWLFDSERKEGDSKVFAANEDETRFYAVRFDSRDTNDYLPINANIISITKDKEDAELKEGEQSSQEKYDALMAAIKEGMTDDEFSTAVTALGYSASSNTLTRTYSNEEIRNYLFDESRKAGDLTTIETDTTYYIVRYVSAAEETYHVDLDLYGFFDNDCVHLGLSGDVDCVFLNLHHFAVAVADLDFRLGLNIDGVLHDDGLLIAVNSLDLNLRIRGYEDGVLHDDGFFVHIDGLNPDFRLGRHEDSVFLHLHLNLNLGLGLDEDCVFQNLNLNLGL